MMTAVEQFWTTHTVRSEPFTSAAESLSYLEWRSADYPLFHKLMDLWGDHREHTVLDYGCGPGNDVVGLLGHGHAREVIGMDVSSTALDLARRRLMLHTFEGSWSLVKVSDAEPRIPLDDHSIDHIHCEGVLHHASYPLEILSEFHRILRPGGTAAVMVYNRESIYLHMYIAFIRQLREGVDAGLPIEQAFANVADGGGCPIARVYRPAEFADLARIAGFRVEYRGSYPGSYELDLWRSWLGSALAEPRLPAESREFLLSLESVNGLPYKDGLPVGLGGVYWLRP